MEIRVERVTVAVGSTVGLLFGRPVDDETKVVVAGADWRAAVQLGVALEAVDEPILVDVPDWAVLGVLELPPER